jgi:hypothetical protein
MVAMPNPSAPAKVHIPASEAELRPSLRTSQHSMPFAARKTERASGNWLSISGDSSALQDQVVALLGPSTKAEFEFHVTDWLGGASKGQPVLPEVKKLGGRPPVLCLHGSKESDSLCPSLTAAQGKSVELPGAHHFGGDYEAVASLILKEAQGK